MNGWQGATGVADDILNLTCLTFGPMTGLTIPIRRDLPSSADQAWGRYANIQTNLASQTRPRDTAPMSSCTLDLEGAGRGDAWRDGSHDCGLSGRLQHGERRKLGRHEGNKALWCGTNALQIHCMPRKRGGGDVRQLADHREFDGGDMKSVRHEGADAGTGTRAISALRAEMMWKYGRSSDGSPSPQFAFGARATTREPTPSRWPWRIQCRVALSWGRQGWLREHAFAMQGPQGAKGVECRGD